MLLVAKWRHRFVVRGTEYRGTGYGVRETSPVAGLDRTFMKPSKLKGRGSQINPPVRFQRLEAVNDDDHLESDEDALPAVPTEYFFDDTKSIISENDSPDICFRYSMNPYRGCSHGCSYCY